ncbi:Multifunctional tryptophan biosynthesis protein [Paramyrothecium foliicola]|nr:Multifunctional tryptophan biosynthesis protein [Paramyrothecium foliicola]
MASHTIIDHSPHQPEPSPPVPTASNLILIDNYDSFTWNIYQYLVLEGAVVHVYRNDKITLEELIQKNPTQLIISPGPGHPSTDSGVSRDAIRHFQGKIPILGVCMGLQCMFDVYGGEVSSAGEWLHGKTSPLVHDSKGVFAGLEQDIPVTRYHSLAGTHVTLPECLEITSWIAKPDGSAGVIQGVRHKEFTIEGVQFHPESILTAGGRKMFTNFLHMQGGTWEENKKVQASPSTTTPKATAVQPKKNNILQQIYASRKAAVAAQKQIPSQRMSDLQAAYDLNAAPPLIPFVQRLRQTPFDVSLMAEIKRASPSKGVFDLEISAPIQAKKYALAGASVISVLTEPEWFKGSIEDLRAVRQVLNNMPNRPAILRKEFIYDEYQILEARLAGADTVLLIVKMLDTALLRKLYNYSLSLGMEPLVEVQNAEEMTIAVELGSKAIGVNNRNLESFEVDLNTTSRLRSMVPENTIICALSGINSHKDVVACKSDGINAVLVGEAIMRAPDASVFISQLCAGIDPPKREPQTNPLYVKICGTRSAEAANEAIESGADFVGICLVPGAKRCISHETALAISRAVHSYSGALNTAADLSMISNAATDFYSAAGPRLRSTRPRLVGIFQNQPLQEVLEKQEIYDLDLVQLHGDEPIEWASIIPVPVVRCFKPGQVGIGLRGYHTIPLLDSGSGSGKLLDVSNVKKVLEKDPELRVFLAGGLNPDNVAEAVKALGPLSERVIGVDVSSGVEEAGKQSLPRITAFIQAAKAIRKEREGEYSMRNILAKEQATRREEARKERGRRNGEKFVNTNLFHIYQDRDFFPYQVDITRDDESTGHVGQRYTLCLWESNAKPPLYWFTAKFLKKKGDSQPSYYRPSPCSGKWRSEMDLFMDFFRIKTGVEWPDRILKEKTTSPAFFQYSPPGGGKPVGRRLRFDVEYCRKINAELRGLQWPPALDVPTALDIGKCSLPSGEEDEHPGSQSSRDHGSECAATSPSTDDLPSPPLTTEGLLCTPSMSEVGTLEVDGQGTLREAVTAGSDAAVHLI